MVFAQRDIVILVGVITLVPITANVVVKVRLDGVLNCQVSAS